MAGCVLWEWRDAETEPWRPYSPDMNFELELAYSTLSRTLHPVVRYEVQGSTREAHVASLRDSPLCIAPNSAPEARRERSVRRCIIEGAGWFWDHGSTWVRYERAEGDELERAYGAKEPKAWLNIGEWRYCVHFSDEMHCQHNLVTRTIRPVIRVDFSGMAGPSFFEVGVRESVLEVRVEERSATESLLQLSLGDECAGEEGGYASDVSRGDPAGVDGANEHAVLVPLDGDDSVDDCDSCVLCLDSFDEKRPAWRLRHCRGHYFHRQCDGFLNIVRILRKQPECPVCKRPYPPSPACDTSKHALHTGVPYGGSPIESQQGDALEQ